jgi:hypothetical protein
MFSTLRWMLAEERMGYNAGKCVLGMKWRISFEELISILLQNARSVNYDQAISTVE